MTDYGPLQGYGADAGDMGKKKLVGTGGPGSVRSKGGTFGIGIREGRGISRNRGFVVSGN